MSHIHQYFHQALFFALHVQGPHTHTEMMDLPPLISLDLFMMGKLVSAVYRCENWHNLFAYDESILSRFPLRSLIPFVLHKRTGMTNLLASTCTSLTAQGVKFQNMETFILHRRLTTFYTL